MIRMKKKIGFISTICLTLFATLFYFKSLNQTNEKATEISNINIKQFEYETAYGSLNELANCSDEQLLINQTILRRTNLFMKQETNELDPKLIEFVRSIIHKPNDKNQINLTAKQKTDFSQIGQSEFMDGVLNSKREEFFIEAGGYNGEDHSVRK
jgi:hypothetical protein